MYKFTGSPLTTMDKLYVFTSWNTTATVATVQTQESSLCSSLFIRYLSLNLSNDISALAPGCLAEMCGPVSGVRGRCRLRSAARKLLHTPRYYLSTYGSRAFSFLMPVHLSGVLFQNICGHLICHLTALDTRQGHFCTHR